MNMDTRSDLGRGKQSNGCRDNPVLATCENVNKRKI